MQTQFWNAVKQRRTHYSLGKERVTTDERILEA